MLGFSIELKERGFYYKIQDDENDDILYTHVNKTTARFKNNKKSDNNDKQKHLESEYQLKLK